MANEIVTIEEILEEYKDTYPRLYNEYKCFQFVQDELCEGIAKAFESCQEVEMVGILINSDLQAGEIVSLITYSKLPKETLKKFLKNETEAQMIDGKAGYSFIPVLCEWTYSENFIEYYGGLEKVLMHQPFYRLGLIPRPHQWAVPKPVPPSPPKKTVTPEKKLEEDLVKWLHSRGVKADNQVSTSKHRMDIWIPGKCFLELKKAKVSGDDVCQAIDYCAEYKKPVVIVGNHISEMASRGIEAFNKAIDSEMLVFVSWSAVKTYLKGLLSSV